MVLAKLQQLGLSPEQTEPEPFRHLLGAGRVGLGRDEALPPTQTGVWENRVYVLNVGQTSTVGPAFKG